MPLSIAPTCGITQTIFHFPWKYKLEGLHCVSQNHTPQLEMINIILMVTSIKRASAKPLTANFDGAYAVNPKIPNWKMNIT